MAEILPPSNKEPPEDIAKVISLIDWGALLSALASAIVYVLEVDETAPKTSIWILVFAVASRTLAEYFRRKGDD